MTLMELQKILGERIRIVSNTEMSMDCLLYTSPSPRDCS